MKSSFVAGLLASVALGLAAFFALPQLIGGTLLLSAESIAGIIGGVLFLLGMLTLEILNRRAETKRLRQTLGSLGQATQRLAKRMQMDTPELSGVKGIEFETMVAEMRVLKTLVEQLSVKRDPASKTAASPSARPPQTVAMQPVTMKTPVIPSTAEPLGMKADEPATAKAPLRAEPRERADWQRVVDDKDAPPLEFPVLRAENPEAPVRPAEPPEPDPADDEELLTLVREALSADRVDLYLQPIVSLPQRKPRHYECFATIRTPEGRVISPEEYKPVAERAGLMATIDNMLLVRCVQLVRRARRQKQPIGFFCDIAGDTLHDAEFFSDFLAFMRENADLAGHLMFSLTQYDVYHLDPRTENELEQLSKIGFRFCMDQATNLDLFVSDLSQKGFRFIKVAAPVLMSTLSRDGDPRALKRALDPGAIDLIVDGIDSESVLRDLLDYAIDFGEGKLFGPPRPDDYR
jgi:cyclic-di-GMP phosphodiesterase TipF (flagellum assembly factor)